VPPEDDRETSRHASHEPIAARSAFNRLYAEQRARVYGFLYRLAGARDRADDLFQETWLRVARSFAGGAAAEVEDEEAWLFTIARNVFLSARRARTVETRAAGALTLVPRPAEPTPERLAQAHQGAAALETALAALSEEDRTILWLVAAEDLDQRQVAAIMGIGYAAVRQRLARARARLNERLVQLEAPRSDPGDGKAESP
jgi:RNA polymerase sigma-70 factor, ECF subfamily